MRRMRRALLSSLLCAAPLLAPPAHASQSLQERQALRAALQLQAGAATQARVVPLPLPAPRGGRIATAAATNGLARIARRPGPQRVLVGVRSHADVAGLARVLARLGAEPKTFESIAVLAATVDSGRALARALAGDPRVAYVERDGDLSVAADPFDIPDPENGNLKFTWYYDDVRAADALAAAGGGSRRTIAVVDTGLDVRHPEFAGRIAGRFDTSTGRRNVTDVLGHGTFVTGLIAAIDGNGIGGKGVAGNTKVLAVRASLGGRFTEGDLLRGIQYAMRRGADVLNMSVAGDGINRSVVRALGTAFYNDVLPVAASGNLARSGNPVQFPAAVVGGTRGGTGIGLSVAATTPTGSVAGFSTHNRFVSLSAPGGSGDCHFGVFSTLPTRPNTDWDRPARCRSRLHAQGKTRFAYGEGTSFAAPIVSGIAALAWQIEPRLASEQVADVLTRSARQTRGAGWNEFTGAGVVDGRAATALARRYDVTPPRARGSAVRRGARVRVRVGPTADRTEPGRELAGRVRYGLLLSRHGGNDFRIVGGRRRKPFRRELRLRGGRVNVFLATACDGNGNCGVKRLGRFKP
jgi:subtilisin family serine protease